MARVNITLPDEVVAEARAAGLNISGLAAGALRDELIRRDKIVAAERYLAELAAESGPISEAERLEAEDWAARSFPTASPRVVKRTA